MTTNITNAFKPLRKSDLSAGRQLQQGGDTAPPARIGTLDLARNSNAIGGYAGHVLAQQVGTVTINTTATTPVSVAQYAVQIPAVRMKTSSLTVLKITFRASCGAGTFSVRGVTTAETSAFVTSAAAAAETLTVYVDAQTGLDVDDHNNDVLRIVRIDVQTSNTTTITINRITIEPAWASEDYASAVAAFETNLLHPQADEAWDTNSPCNVQSMRELAAANNYAFIHGFRTPAAYCMWHDTGTATVDAGYIVAENVGTRVPLHQYVYWPRAGVIGLWICATGRVDGWTTSPDHDGKIYVGWQGGGDFVEGTVATATTPFAVGTWQIWGAFLPVPKGVDFLTIWGEVTGSGKEMYIQGFSAIEVVARGTDVTYTGWP